MTYNRCLLECENKILAQPIQHIFCQYLDYQSVRASAGILLWH